MRTYYKIGLSIFTGAVLSGLTYLRYFQEKGEYNPEIAQEWIEYNRNPNDAERSWYITDDKVHNPFHLVTSQDGSRVFRKEEGSRAPGSYARFQDLESGVQQAIREAAKDF